jgi:hypothetical protein
MAAYGMRLHIRLPRRTGESSLLLSCFLSTLYSKTLSGFPHLS